MPRVLPAAPIDADRLHDYLTRYVKAHRRFLQENYPERIRDDWLCQRYPFELIAYTDDFHTTVAYRGANEFSVTIEKVPEVPSNERMSASGWRPWWSAVNRALVRKLEAPEREAENYVLSEIAHEEWDAQQGELALHQYEVELEEATRRRVADYLDYLSATQKVRDDTIAGKPDDIYWTVRLIQSQFDLSAAAWEVGLLYIALALGDSIDNLESSLFLALHGRYWPALGLLRLYFEHIFRAVYQQLAATATAQSAVVEPKPRGSVASPPSRKHDPFTGPGGVLDRLLDSQTNATMSKLLAAAGVSPKSSIKAHLEEVYHHLSQTLHKPASDEYALLSADFATFEPKHFATWTQGLHNITLFNVLLLAAKFPSVWQAYEKKSEESVDIESAMELLPAQVKALLASST